jgi:hypothetical protein
VRLALFFDFERRLARDERLDFDLVLVFDLDFFDEVTLVVWVFFELFLLLAARSSPPVANSNPMSRQVMMVRKYRENRAGILVGRELSVEVC